ncbi:MAG: hypothetical protein H6908_06745, partial [Hyphomicrobiales bacterium]|nr:hypothetical protein [Hyphomicrobiales bacterium]
MKTFLWQGIENGQQSSGHIEAGTLEEAKALLISRKVIPTSIKPVAEHKKKG